MSYDFRTPLTSMLGAASTQLEPDAKLSEPQQKELLARIRALLRLPDSPAAARSDFECGGLVVSVPQHRVTLDGEAVHLSWKGFDLLRLLMENGDWIVTQSQILSRLLGKSHGVALTDATW